MKHTSLAHNWRARLQELGYRVVIIPSDLQRAAIHAMQDVLAAIARDGHSANLADRMASFAEREAIVGTKALLECGKRYTADRSPPPDVHGSNGARIRTR